VTPCAQTPLDAWVKAKIGLSPTSDLTRQALEAYQLKRLRSVLNDVKHRSPFYRRHFSGHAPDALQSINDLARWPLTSADDLRRNPLGFLCVSQSAVERVVTLPSRPPQDPSKRLFFSAADLELAVDFFHHGFATSVGREQRILVLMPCRHPYSVGDLLARGLSRLYAIPVTHGPMQSPRAVVHSILYDGIDGLVGTPTEILALSRYAGRDRIPCGQIKSIWLGTQNTRRSEVKEINRIWKCPVYQHYGADEMCPGGGVQCMARTGFHLREADLLIEIVDPLSVQPAPDGAYGEVIVTTLTREAMPLVRYRTGHWAAVMTGPCPCGSGLRRLTSIAPMVDVLPNEERYAHGCHCQSRQ
jgi:phenylacetate-coenzyme A ligase PaaK-like adenylate-forming protein